MHPGAPVPKVLATILAFATIALLAVVIAMSISRQSQQADADRRQRDTDQKLADLQRRLDNPQAPAATTPPIPTTPASAPAAPGGGAPSGGGALSGGGTLSVVEKQRQTATIISEGFRLLASRKPADAQQAILLFQEGVDKIDDKNPAFYHGLGRAYIVLKQYDKAIDILQQGRRAAPDSSEITSALGWALFDQGQFYQARLTWERAIALDPHYLDPWSAMAWIYLAIGERDKAVTGFQVLVDSGAERKDWIYGLGMARARNTNLEQIRSQFPAMPDPTLFTTPPATSPATPAR